MTRFPKLCSTCPMKHFLEKHIFLNKKLNFHQCWTLKRNLFGILSNIRQRRHDWRLRVEWTFWLKRVLLVRFFVFFSGVDEKKILKVWWKIYGRVAKTAFNVSRRTFSDKTFFFWDNCFCLSIFDFPGQNCNFWKKIRSGWLAIYSTCPWEQFQGKIIFSKQFYISIFPTSPGKNQI